MSHPLIRTPYKTFLPQGPLATNASQIVREVAATMTANTASLLLRAADMSALPSLQRRARDFALQARTFSQDLAPTGTTGKLNPKPLAISIPDQGLALKTVMQNHMIEIGKSDDVLPNEVRRFILKMGTELLDVIVFRTEEGQIYAGKNICDHYGIEVQEGHVNTQGNLVCPRHGFCQDHATNTLSVPYIDENHTQKRMKLGSNLTAIESNGRIYITQRQSDAQQSMIESTKLPSKTALSLIDQKRAAQFKAKDGERRWALKEVITPVLSLQEFKQGVRQFTLSNETFTLESDPVSENKFYVIDSSRKIIPNIRATIKNNMVFTYPSSLGHIVESAESHFNDPNWATFSKIVDADPRSVLIANLEGDHAAYVHFAILVGRMDHKDLKIESHFEGDVFHLKLTSIQKHSPLYSVLGVGLNDRVELTFRINRNDMYNYLDVNWYNPVTGEKRAVSVNSLILTTPITENKTRITILTNVLAENKGLIPKNPLIRKFTLKILHGALNLLVAYDSSYDIDAVMRQPISTEDKGIRKYIKDRDDYLRTLQQWYEGLWRTE